MKKNTIIIFIIVLLSIISIAEPSAYFKGYIFNRKSKFPVVNAQVEVAGRMTFTDSKGTFDFKDLVIGNLILKVTANGFKDYIELVKIEHGSNSQNFYIEPKPITVKARGMIENSDTGLGVSNINISFDNIMGQTDEYGEFYMDNLTPGKYIVKISHVDYEKYIDEVTVTEANINNFKFYLKPLIRYGKIIGELRDQSGDLVSSAQVIIGKNQPVNISGGKFILEDIVRSKYKMVVYADGYEPYEENILVDDITKVKIILNRDRDFRFDRFEKHVEGKDVKKDIPVKVKGSLEGFVRDAGSMKELAGVTLSIDGKYTVTGKDGMYYFHDLEPGDHTLSIIASDYGVYSADIYIKPGAGVFNISLKEENKDALIYGKVYDKKTQKAVIGARVVIGEKNVKTDVKGFYQFKVDLDDYVEVKVFIGKVLFFRKIVYMNSVKQRNDIFLEVD